MQQSKTARAGFFLHFLGIIMFLVGMILSQYFFDVEKKRVAETEPLVLQPGIARTADLGLHNATADLAWLAAIQYVGGSSTSLDKLNDYLTLSTSLDPKFSYPYAFGALVLPAFGHTDDAIILAKKGITDAKPDWRIPYYLATTYHINKNDTANAAKYFDLAARTPGAPANIQVIAANYGSRSDLREKTKQIWLGILENSKDEVVIDQAKRYVIHFQILDFLEGAAKEYQKQTGKLPATPNDLVSAKILTAVPSDPFGLEYKFDTTGRAVIKD